MPQAPASGLQSIVEGGVKKQIGRDPAAEAAAKRAEASKVMGYTDEEKAKFEANQAGLEALNKAQMDPEKLRQQQLEDFLLGAAGHSTAGITLGSAGKAAVGRERMQDALKYGRMGELAKRGEDYMESGRKAREEGFKVGEKAGEQAEMGTRQGIASGASMVDKDKELVNAGLDRKSREYIARLSASVQHEANTASKEGNLLAKYQTILGNATKNEEAAISRIQKESPDGKLLTNLASMEAFGKLDKDQIAQKNAASARLEAQVVAVRNKFAEDRDMVMSLVNSVGGGSGLGGLTGGNKGWGKVEEVKPTKK